MYFHKLYLYDHYYYKISDAWTPGNVAWIDAPNQKYQVYLEHILLLKQLLLLRIPTIKLRFHKQVHLRKPIRKLYQWKTCWSRWPWSISSPSLIQRLEKIGYSDLSAEICKSSILLKFTHQVHLFGQFITSWRCRLAALNDIFEPISLCDIWVYLNACFFLLYLILNPLV